MTTDFTSITCPGCGASVEGKPKLDFYGISRVSCSGCGNRITLPLPPLYRIFYFLLLGIMLVVFYLTSHFGALMGVLVALGVLAEDNMARHALRSARRARAEASGDD